MVSMAEPPSSLRGQTIFSGTVAPAQRVDFTAHWAVCDPTATSCTGSEGYAYLDPQSHDVVTAREGMLLAVGARE